MPKGQNSITSVSDDLQTRLGATIKADRQLLGVTQEELAWRAGMHRTYLASIERGKRNITLRSVANLARALEVSVRSLLSRSDVAEPGVRDRPAGGEILMIEDSPFDAELALLAFKKAKFTNPIKIFTTGRDALDYVQNTGKYAKREGELPQMILLDLHLPDISGVEVLRRLKLSVSTARIPVVVLTMANEDEHAVECSQLGAAGYIVKPVGFQNFSQAVGQLNSQWTLDQVYKPGTI